MYTRCSRAIDSVTENASPGRSDGPPKTWKHVEMRDENHRKEKYIYILYACSRRSRLRSSFLPADQWKVKCALTAEFRCCQVRDFYLRRSRQASGLVGASCLDLIQKQPKQRWWHISFGAHISNMRSDPTSKVNWRLYWPPKFSKNPQKSPKYQTIMPAAAGLLGPSHV